MAASRNLPDPDESSEADVVLFDGECRFCRGQVENLRRLDRGGHRLAFLSLHDPRVGERYPDLSHDQLMEQMYVVDQQGQRHGGADAVRYLSRRLPILWPLAPLLHVPGSAGLWRWMYQQVAKHRYRLAGKTEEGCAGERCRLHFDKPPAGDDASQPTESF
jgi:predicted DCC family thiol-disulfide oxidoreductase YuxK